MFYNKVVGFEVVRKFYVEHLLVQTCFDGRIVLIVLLIWKVLIKHIVAQFKENEGLPKIFLREKNGGEFILRKARGFVENFTRRLGWTTG